LKSLLCGTALLIAAPLTASDTPEPSASETMPIATKMAALYGADIKFDVYRKGKRIGTHSVDFDKQDGTHTITSGTKLKVKFLFFTAYKFSYSSSEVWSEDELVKVDSVTNDGGDIYETFWDPEAEKHLLPTNHWNPEVLEKSKIYNTISGKLDEVTITPGDWYTIETNTGPRKAQRFEYSGDLENVSVWYDEQQRWVGMEFEGTDGSMIKYRCKMCGV